LPFDQHWLIALVAPRPLIAADGLADPVSSIRSLKASYDAAKPVYELLSAPDNLGVHYRPGGHMLAPEDWQAILDFADARLRNKPTAQRFDEFPATAPSTRPS
jgi:endo-1,4-beta-xylanase